MQHIALCQSVIISTADNLDHMITEHVEVVGLKNTAFDFEVYGYLQGGGRNIMSGVTELCEYT